MDNMKKILSDLKNNTDETLSDFYSNLIEWEKMIEDYDQVQDMDPEARVELIREAYINKVKEQCRQLLPTPVQGKDYGVFVDADPGSGQVIIKFEAYSEIGQILMEKMASDSKDIGIAWLEEQDPEDQDWD